MQCKFCRLHCPTLTLTHRWILLFCHQETPLNTAWQQLNKDWLLFQCSEDMQHQVWWFRIWKVVHKGHQAFSPFAPNCLGTGQKVQGGWAGTFRNVVVKKTHDPPLPIGAKRSDPPLDEGWKSHDPPPYMTWHFWLNNQKKITFCGWNCGVIYVLDLFFNSNTKLCKNNIVSHYPCNFKSWL